MGLDFSIRPADLQEVDLARRSQAKMETRIILRKVAAAASHLVYLAGIPGDDTNARPDGAPVAVRPGKLNGGPVIVVLALQAIEVHRLIHVIDDHIQISVVVDVAKRAAASRAQIEYGTPNALRNILEARPLQVPVDDLALAVVRFGLELVDLRINMTI